VVSDRTVTRRSQEPPLREVRHDEGLRQDPNNVAAALAALALALTVSSPLAAQDHEKEGFGLDGKRL
tara:strand:+ start:72 stop:272 length:201 start_codon:yes stop_codon:yes gene_type:complete